MSAGFQEFLLTELEGQRPFHQFYGGILSILITPLHTLL
jgi:hypothetical protein